MLEEACRGKHEMKARKGKREREKEKINKPNEKKPDFLQLVLLP
jgi:hypothetical protein